MQRRWIANACAGSLVLLGLAALALPSHAVDAECETLRDQADLYNPKSSDPYLFTEFALNGASQRARRPVHAELDRRFGLDLKTDSSLRLSRGLIGVVLDYDRKGLAIVVDQGLIDRPGLQQALNREAAAGRTANPGSTADPVTVVASCFSAADLVTTYQELRDQKALGGLPYGYSLNPRNSTWEIYTSAYSEEAQEFARRHSGRVSVVPVDIGPGSTDRYNDRQPHWGGARITRRSVGGSCTSGFTVNSESSAEGQAHVTAGHCWPVGSVVDSGSFYFGNVIRRPNFPLYDSALLNAADQNYDDNIYDGVNNNATANAENIDMSGVDTVAGGDLVCVSGSVSRRVCNLVVDRVTGACPQAGGETTALIVAQKIGSTVFVNGDSGGPMYTRTSGNRIAGMNVCGVDEELLPNGPFDLSFAEQWTNVTSNLDVCVATTDSYQAC